MPLRRLTISAAALLCVAAAAFAQGGAAFQVIVRLDNPAAALATPELSDIFLKKTVQWPDGAAIEPVDLSGEPEVREAFSRQVHVRSTSKIKNYWNQTLFSGRGVPPPELATSRDVARYVAGHAGAIGYVAAGETFEGVKVVGVIVPPTVIQRVEAAYPPAAVAAHVSGEVILSVGVDKDGRVAALNPVKGLPLGLTAAAVRAVQAWRFSPATLNGQPVAQTVQVVVRFGGPKE